MGQDFREKANMMENILDKLKSTGFVYIKNKELNGNKWEKFKQILSRIGKIVSITHIIPNNEVPALVKSKKALSLHTDHPRVRFIAWYCKKQDPEGGISLLKDGYKVLNKFSPEKLKELERICLREHKVFDDDPDKFPILSYERNKIHFYYTFWLANKEEKENKVFRKLSNIIKSEEDLIKIHLKEGDILIIDNWRFLHGRTEIKNHRHLIRHWLFKI